MLNAIVVFSRWTHLLSSFLTSLKTCIVQRINAEHSPRGVNEDSYLDEEEGSNEGDDEGKSEEADVDVEDVAEGVPELCIIWMLNEGKAHVFSSSRHLLCRGWSSRGSRAPRASE